MAGRANRVTDEFRYVLKDDRERDPGEQSAFYLRPLTGPERARVWDEMQWTVEEPDGTRRLTSRAFQQSRRLVLDCLTRVENFPAGEPQPYPADQPMPVREKWLDQLDDMSVLELGNEIVARCVLGVAEKNS